MAFAPADSCASTLTTAFYKPSHTCSGHRNKTAIYKTYKYISQSLWNDQMPDALNPTRVQVKNKNGRKQTYNIRPNTSTSGLCGNLNSHATSSLLDPHDPEAPSTWCLLRRQHPHPAWCRSIDDLLVRCGILKRNLCNTQTTLLGETISS